MAYVQGGDVRAKRSPSIWTVMHESFLNLLNFILAFFKTMFSLDAQENYGRPAGTGQPGGPARPSGSAAPRATNNVHTLFGSSGGGDHGNVHVINSSRAWQTKVNEAKTARKVIVVDFTASWCGPCKLMAPVFAELSKKFTQLVFVKVDVDEVQEVAARYGVRAMPTFLFIKDGQQVDSVVGANKNELESKCSRYAR